MSENGKGQTVSINDGQTVVEERLTPEAVQQLALNMASVLLQRARLAGSLGLQFNGDRDLYTVLGYKTEIEPQDYWNAFYRSSLVARGVKAHPKDTWKRPPVLIDGSARSDEQEPKSEFLRQWNALVERLKLWPVFRRADILGRMGRYGIILIGVRDGMEFDQPVPDTLPGGLDSVLYLRPYAELDAAVDRLVTDPQSERFGQPLYYRVNLGEGLGNKLVHHSRVLHVAEDLLQDGVYGVPVLEAVFNRIYDLEKVVGGSSEAFWLMVRKGLAILARPDSELSQDSAALADFEAQVENYVHKLSRVMRLQGVDVQELGSDVVDASGQFNVLLDIISADLNVPQRKLIGSERGELASSQDERNWAAEIRARQEDYAEPSILLAFVDWLRRHKVIAEPSSEIEVEWPPAYEPTAQERASEGETVARALSTFTGGAAEYAMPVEVFTERYFDHVPESVPVMIAAEEDDDEGGDAGGDGGV